eukprot:43606_1
MEIAVFSREFVILILFITFIATSFLGAIMLTDGVIEDSCPNLDGSKQNPRYFSVGTFAFMTYYVRYFAAIYCENHLGQACGDARFGIFVEILFGLIWCIWGIRGFFLYYNELSKACQDTHTGNVVLAYAILLIIIGIIWMQQGITSAMKKRQSKVVDENAVLMGGI